jgi:hypothetical protein
LWLLQLRLLLAGTRGASMPCYCVLAHLLDVHAARAMLLYEFESLQGMLKHAVVKPLHGAPVTITACGFLQDIAHTFPNHRWLREPDGQAALRRVLAAYSVHNEEVGYCRPMVHIVALLLVALNR